MAPNSSYTFEGEWGPYIGSDAAGVTRVGKGYARYLPTASTTLATTPTAGVAIPSEARHMIFVVEVAAVRVRWDGTAPTASEGILFDLGAWKFPNSRALMDAMRFIQVSAGAQVTIGYGY